MVLFSRNFTALMFSYFHESFLKQNYSKTLQIFIKSKTLQNFYIILGQRHLPMFHNSWNYWQISQKASAI